jgi:hypothetical protein
MFDAKIVNTKTKFGGTSVMLPKSSRVRARMVSLGSKLIHEVLVRKDGHLLQPAHSLFDARANVAVGSDQDCIASEQLLGNVCA